MAVIASRPLTNCQSLGVPSTVRSHGVGKRIVRMLRLWRARIRERQAFAQIDDFALRDLGVSRWEVERELAKPFWRG